VFFGIPIFCVGSFISFWTVCPHRKNDVLVVPLANQVFRYLLLFSNEIKRERWVDEDVNLPRLFLRNFFSCYGLPNSDSANAVRRPMGCRTPIRQMPSGILFFQRTATIIGKSEFANPLKDCDIIGKSEFANPLKVCDIIGKERICQPIKGLRTFWQRKNLPTH